MAKQNLNLHPLGPQAPGPLCELEQERCVPRASHCPKASPSWEMGWCCSAPELCSPWMEDETYSEAHSGAEGEPLWPEPPVSRAPSTGCAAPRGFDHF